MIFEGTIFFPYTPFARYRKYLTRNKIVEKKTETGHNLHATRQNQHKNNRKIKIVSLHIFVSRSMIKLLKNLSR